MIALAPVLIVAVLAAVAWLPLLRKPVMLGFAPLPAKDPRDALWVGQSASGTIGGVDVTVTWGSDGPRVTGCEYITESHLHGTTETAVGFGGRLTPVEAFTFAVAWMGDRLSPHDVAMVLSHDGWCTRRRLWSSPSMFERSHGLFLPTPADVLIASIHASQPDGYAYEAIREGPVAPGVLEALEHSGHDCRDNPWYPYTASDAAPLAGEPLAFQRRSAIWDTFAMFDSTQIANVVVVSRHASRHSGS